MATQLFFWFFAFTTVASAILTVALRNPVHCGLALLSVLINMAGFFVLLNAEFIAAVQIIVYAGAILILYLFVLMLLDLKGEERHYHRRAALYLFFGLVVLGQLIYALIRSSYAGRPGTMTPEAVIAFGHAQAIGITIFNDHFLAFEIIGVFLTGAIIGAIVLAKEAERLSVKGTPSGRATTQELPLPVADPLPIGLEPSVGVARDAGRQV
jgi:NADH-quinone oxidoreductase subunit J